MEVGVRNIQKNTYIYIYREREKERGEGESVLFVSISSIKGK